VLSGGVGGCGGRGGCGIGAVVPIGDGGIGATGGFGIGAGAEIGAGAAGAAVIWLTFLGPPLAVGIEEKGVADMTELLLFGAPGVRGLLTGGFTPPNSKTAGRVGACAELFPIVTSAPPPGRAKVKPAFFSTALKEVSSCSITGAGAVGAGAGIGTGVGIGIDGAPESEEDFGIDAGAGIFDQPTSESIEGLIIAGAEGDKASAWIMLGPSGIFS